MTDLEAAWLAGFFDGEGCLYVRKGGLEWSITVTNTDLPSLEKCFKTTGVGHIYDKKVQGARKKTYQWQVYRKAHVRAVLESVRPFITNEEKTEKIDRFLAL